MLYGATAMMGFGVAIMQPALPALVRAWVPAHVGLGTAVSTNGMVIGATLGSALSIPFVLPWVGESWRLDLVLWSALTGLIAILFAAVSPRAVSADPDLMSAAKRWWPDWKSPLTWLLGLAFGSTNALYYGTNAFLPDHLVAHGRPDLVGAALAWLNGSQLIASCILLVAADWLHRRAWPYLVFGPLTVAGLLVMVLGDGGWIVLAAAVVGFAAAVPFVLLLALPPALSAPGEVHRTAAGMFTISYTCAVIVPGPERRRLGRQRRRMDRLRAARPLRHRLHGARRRAQPPSRAPRPAHDRVRPAPVRRHDGTAHARGAQPRLGRHPGPPCGSP